MESGLSTPDGRGVKRRLDDAEAAPAPAPAPKRIKALDPDVINKIAAGEIIVAPMHALKELIENSVDAGATSIDIVVKDGGLKLLQITDNGHGIHRDDLPILCERFTTSKLAAFEDLTSIATYGFRGEALASISHIAHLTITSRTRDSSCAWRAVYADGKIASGKAGQAAEPKPTHGNPGTQITVEDLFYNMPQRRKAFRSPGEEYAKILDVVGRYAIHCEKVSFSCKRHNENAMNIAVQPGANTIDRIRQIHGSAVANELMPFQTENSSLGYAASGWSTNANYHVKKTTILLFINHRAVESSSLRSAVQRLYSALLPKGGHPFLYLSLEIDPQRVDVNVHPTKREVNFLNEDQIIEEICDCIGQELAKVDTSRTFMTQSLLPAVSTPVPDVTPIKTPATLTRATSKPAENKFVRTDPATRKITSMFPSTGREQSQRASEPVYTTIERTHMQIRLTTIKELRGLVREALHGGLAEMLAVHTYVGLVDSVRRIAAIQSGVKMFLVDYGMLCNELFYQLGLTDFGNFGSIVFETPLDLASLIQIAADAETKNQAGQLDLSSAPARITNLLVEKREMLEEYFSLNITPDGQLQSIPLLIKGYMPSLAKLPRFLLRLGPCVDWTRERECFETFLTELAAFYTPEQLPNPPAGPSDAQNSQCTRDRANDSQADQDDEPESMDTNVPTHESSNNALGNISIDPKVLARRKTVEHALEHTLFPAIRSRLVATKGLLSGVLEVADLKGLYRVFERC